MGIMVPQAQKKDGLGKLMSVAQIAGGIASSNPMQALSGVSGLKQQSDQTQPTSAIERRASSLQDSQNNLTALRNAESAVTQLPPPQQAQYGDAIMRARKMAEQGY